MQSARALRPSKWWRPSTLMGAVQRDPPPTPGSAYKSFIIMGLEKYWRWSWGSLLPEIPPDGQ